jgi:hypothetical protein
MVGNKKAQIFGQMKHRKELFIVFGKQLPKDTRASMWI